MIYVVLWVGICVVGIWSQTRLFLRAFFSVQVLDPHNLTTTVARTRMWASLLRLVVFALGIALAVIAVAAPQFSTFLVGPTLIAILFGFMFNGVVEARMWRRIDRAIRQVPGSVRDQVDLEMLDELDRMGRG